ncbi:MAG: hypothetical protein ACYDCL_15760 [Myxococcales bacterium]
MKRIVFFAAAAALAGCSSGGVSPAPDAGGSPPADSGACGALCAPPDAGECAALGGGCTATPCCPGGACDGGICTPLANPCPDGEQILADGCGCDPELGILCGPGSVCGPDLHCEADAGFVPLPALQPLGAPCDPGAAYGDAGPPCATPDGSLPVDCVTDPSGAELYVCEQSCGSDGDCPLAWQSCGSTFAAAGHCGDTPCTGFPAPPTSPAFFQGCKLPGGESGLCLPFSVPVASGGVTLVSSYGLCVQASDAGAAAPCATPPLRGDGGLCDAEEICLLGRCRLPCDPLDGGAPGAVCESQQICVPAALQAPVPGAAVEAGGCVLPCEAAGDCDAGPVDAGHLGDAGAPAGGPPDGGDGGG